MKKNKILIVGNGNIGQAIFYLLNSNPLNKKFTIEVYDKNSTKNKSKKALKDCATGANFIFLCIPSWVEEEVLLKIKPFLKRETILISLSKGINMATSKSVDKLIESDVRNAKYALLSGPMFAVEIKKGQMSFAILASKNKTVFEKVSKLFTGTTLKLEYAQDVHSVAISGVLKNIYTLLFGIVDGFRESNNVKGFLATQSLKEMMQIMKILKLNEGMILEISGLGDFIATCESQYSQNRKVGIEIYKKGHTILKSEGLISLPLLLKMLGQKTKNLPLLSLLEEIIVNKKDAKNELKKFFKNL
jgi:glycerol-3-phosphate dehydrogenase (NAD(P)+)